MSTVKVNTVDKRTGGTLTLGGCGTTVTLGAGATQSGFGRTGTVDWCTTAKTAPFTGVSGNGYFVNTTSGVVTVTLPATPSAGDIISIADYASTFQTNNLTLCRNSSKINGVCANSILNTEGQSITLVYVDGTRGWKNTMDSTSDITGNAFIVATGGTITCCGDYKIHTFTSDGTFCVSAANVPANANVDYLVVAGGGGGGEFYYGGGGGAGGYRESKCATTSGCWTASPLASSTSLTISAQAYPITVGGGGAGGTGSQGALGSSGSPSVFSTITSSGGGRGGSSSGPGAPNPSSPTPGANGGSGAGGGGSGDPGPSPSGTGGTGNTPPVSPPQGNSGGVGNRSATAGAGGGGGGATVVGAGATTNCGGNGGNGATSSINATPTTRAGGGGGGAYCGTLGTGGSGGGGNGGNNTGTAAQLGTSNTGGGGGGAGSCTYSTGGTGGSGIVIIRYKFQ
jgi:hypothetical protein